MMPLPLANSFDDFDSLSINCVFLNGLALFISFSTDPAGLSCKCFDNLRNFLTSLGFAGRNTPSCSNCEEIICVAITAHRAISQKDKNNLTPIEENILLRIVFNLVIMIIFAREKYVTRSPDCFKFIAGRKRQ